MVLGLALWGNVCRAQQPISSAPTEGGPAGYVGSSACKECHEDPFTSWHRSHHRTMTQYPSTSSVQARFEGVLLTNGPVRYRLDRSGNNFRVWLEEHGRGPADPPPAPPVETRISLVTGSHHMQVFWMPTESGNAQAGFPFTWLIPEARWVPRGSTFIRPPGTAHQTEVWNVGCSRCHATAIEPRVDATRRTMETRAAEMGISCEACHGPGERHVMARRKNPLERKVPAEALAREIVQPARLDAARSTEVCGFCHSMKWIDRNEPWRQGGFRFRPGDRLDASTPLIRPSTADQVPGLREFLRRNTNILSEYFWSDGMVRVSGREMNGLVDSPCFGGGKLSCVTCHSMHDSDPNDQLSRKARGNAACVECHPKFSEATAWTHHTRHAAGSPGSDCYNCHMPHTTYGVLGAIRSHQITRPSASETLKTGRPNACTACHLDRSLKWAAEKLHEGWRQPIPNGLDASHEIADSVRLVLTGDAGQRALSAWHLGWSAAGRASGTHWIAPILGVLLDDDYAAVRCVAGRSLEKVAPGLLPGYRFELEDDARDAVHETVWRRWIDRLGPGARIPETVLVRPDSPEQILQRLGPWLEKRDERPVRLRE